MLHRVWLIVASFVFLFALTQHARATEINSANYNIYSGDINSDGVKDFVFNAKRNWLIIHDNIATPIQFGLGMDLVIYRDGTGYSSPVALALTQAEIAAKVLAGTLTLLQENTGYFIWKNGSSTQSNLLLRGDVPGSPALLLASYADILFPVVAQIYSPDRFEGISTPTVKLTITDVNSDGRKDILLEDQTVAAWKTAYLATSAGVPITFNQVVASTTRPVITPVATPTEPTVLVGATPYTADVNRKGEASISVPIKVPQGIGGMQPRLSLNYNSGGTAADKNVQSASGVLGFGWSMSGLSDIRRCTTGKLDLQQTVDPYNAASGIQLYRPWLNYDATDSLCLDGQLLILISGVHFQAGAIYRTYTESFKRIILYGEGNSIWFRVENPNGSIAHYGLNSHSRVQKYKFSNSAEKTAPFQWGVEVEEDRAGNRMTYSYQKNEDFSYSINLNRLWVTSIFYNQNIQNNVQSYSVQFDYTPIVWGLYENVDSTNQVLYPANVIDRYSFSRQASPQLKTVRVNRGGDELEYRIEGSNQSDDQIRSAGLRVGKISECYKRATISRCLKPLVFNWADTFQSPPPTETITQHHLNNMVDSLGAITKFGFYANRDLYFFESPFDVPPGDPGTWPAFAGTTVAFSGYKPSKIYVVTKLERSTAIAPDKFQTLLYRYSAVKNYQEGSTDPEIHVTASNSSYGLGFLGFRAIRITDEATGIVTYNQYASGNSFDDDLLVEKKLAASYKYDGVYGVAGTKPISKMETWNEVKFISHGSYGSTRVPTVKQITNYNYENGQLLGVTVKTNNYIIINGLISQIVTTVSNGSALEALPYLATRNWGQTALYKLTASSTKNTKVTTTNFRNVIGDPGYYTSAAHMVLPTNWYIGAISKKVETFYNGAIGVGNYTDTKVQTADYEYMDSLMKVTGIKRFAGDVENEITEMYGYDLQGRQSYAMASGANIQDRTSWSTYSSLVSGSNIVPSTTTNALGHEIVNSNFDRRHDLPQTVTDANGLVTTQEFDSIGRLLAATDSNGVKTTQAYISCETVACATVDGKFGAIAPVYFKEIVSAISPKTKEYYDARGRVVRTETQGFAASDWIRTDIQYNEQGRVYKSSLPYKTGSTPQYVTNSYDKFGRLINVQQPDGGSVQTVYDAATGSDGYTQLRTISTESIKKADGSAAGTQAKTSYVNSAGQLTKTIDAANTTTSFEYDALGNVNKTTVNGGVDGTTVSTATYDNAGNRTSITDPNAGTISSKYTSLGQLRWMKDSKNNEATFTYDKLGRPLTRTSVDGTSNWFYDPVGAKGHLSYTTNNSGYKQTYFYEDNYRAARLSRIETNISVSEVGLLDKTYTDYINYDVYGRAQKMVSPSGFSSIQNYNAQGYPSSLYRSDSMSAVQTTVQMGAFGIEQENFANNVTTTRAYEPSSGRIKSIKTTINTTDKVQDLSYKWLSSGSLETRTNNKSGTPIVDAFSYDNLDRLTETNTSLSGATQRTLTQTYNNLGNIKSNISSNTADAQVTNYNYGTATVKPHAVTSATINGVSYILNYDSNGAIEMYDAAGTGQDKFIAYNAANQPTKITVGTSLNDANPVARDEFRYTPDGARYYKKATYKEGSRLRMEHTFYIGGYETTYYDAFSTLKQTEKTQVGSSILNIRKTPYSGAMIQTWEVLHRDHLGSVDAVTQGSTKLIDLAFEPFGARRSNSLLTNISTTEMTNLLAKSDVLNSQGYTGHESLDRTGFIHMNGRVYDPQLVRFLSPDPMVQSPTNSQSWNRYSYVFNNPLKYTDPTGFAGLGCAGGTFRQEGYANKNFANTCGGSMDDIAAASRDSGSSDLEIPKENIAQDTSQVKADGVNGVNEANGGVSDISITDALKASYLEECIAGSLGSCSEYNDLQIATGEFDGVYLPNVVSDFYQTSLSSAFGGAVTKIGTPVLSTLGAARFANYIIKNPSVLRWMPQSAVKATLSAANWAAGSMRATTAARGGWSMILNPGPAARVQWSAAGGRHVGDYWKVTSPELGTLRIPYFFNKFE